jgi:hypothetical protein
MAARESPRTANLYERIAGFMARLRQSAEQLDALGRWYRILSEALRHYLHGRQLEPPIRLNPRLNRNPRLSHPTSHSRQPSQLPDLG